MSNIIQMKMSTNPRLLKDVLTLYKSTFFALKELIDNSVQARSKKITINLVPSSCPESDLNYKPIESIEVIDDGEGVPFSLFKESIMEIATNNKAEGKGVGRFGALQIGHKMEIDTTAFDKASKKWTHTKVTIDASSLSQKDLQEIEFPIETEEIEESTNSCYSVKISQLYTNSTDKLKKKNKLSEEFFSIQAFNQGLFENYPLAIFEGKVKFIVNENELEREDFLIGKPKIKKVTILCSDGKEHTISLRFYQVKLKSNDLSIFFQVNNDGVMQSIARYSYCSPWHTPDAGTWYILIDSDLITPDMIADFALSDFGNDCKTIQEQIKSTIDEFFKAGNKKFLSFIERLRKDPSYPFGASEIVPLEETIFNHTAYLFELNHKLLETSNAARAVIYPMVKRLIEDGNTEFLYNEILKLSDDSREKFKDLLTETELDDVVQFSSSVAKRTSFLNFLYDLCYGDISKWLKERKQLHKIVAKQLWLFGEEYQESTKLWSDTSLEHNLEELHKKYFAYTPSEEDENLIADCKDRDHDITDLFFYNKKKTGAGRSEVMIVELKAPSCAIADKEILQIERYRKDIIDSAAYPKEKVTYKIILISSKFSDSARIKMQSSQTWGNPDDPFLYSSFDKDGYDIRLYVMEWSELIEHNRKKLSYLTESLNVKPQDVGERFTKEYPQLIDEKSRNRLN